MSCSMNLGRFGLLVGGLGILVAVGCASRAPFPESTLTGGLFVVKIGETLTPEAVTAKRGDEVRWVNMSSGPVDISFVETRDDLISCQKGFASTDLGYLFGSLEYETIVIATLPPNESANLCFAFPGRYVYTVRWNPPLTGHANKITGSIMIE